MPCVDHASDSQNHEGSIRCDRCNILYVPCPECGAWHNSGLGSTDCTNHERCDHCGTQICEEQITETVTGAAVCPACRDNRYWRCGDCHAWNPNGETCDNGCCDPEGCTCDDCLANAGLAGRVHDWSYKPHPVFHGSGPLFLGAEIEIETPYDDYACADLAQAHLGELGYLKADGSIGHGFEIVTHPMSYEWAIANFPWPMLTRLAESGCMATDRTGIHVHLSRAGFNSGCHAYRWMKFIYRNQHQVTRVARRRSQQWAAFTDEDRKAVKHYIKNPSGHRYRAINTGNPDTFELRIFASSLNPSDVQAALAFAAASVEYTRTLTAATILNQDGWAWPAFVDWLTQNPMYAPLRRQMEALSCAY